MKGEVDVMAAEAEVLADGKIFTNYGNLPDGQPPVFVTARYQLCPVLGMDRPTADDAISEYLGKGSINAVDRNALDEMADEAERNRWMLRRFGSTALPLAALCYRSVVGGR